MCVCVLMVCACVRYVVYYLAMETRHSLNKLCANCVCAYCECVCRVYVYVCVCACVCSLCVSMYVVYNLTVHMVSCSEKHIIL